MKLYFYFLDTYGRNPKGLCVEEREAKEKPKTYKAVDGIFPNGYGTVRKDDVGRITDFDRFPCTIHVPIVYHFLFIYVNI